MAEDQVSSQNGYRMFPQGNYRVLNIFVNIIYDQTPERDPLKDNFEDPWPSVTKAGLNESIPTYLSEFLDTDFAENKRLNGTMTRLYFESSFGALLILGDFVVVNILQSDLSSKTEGQNFDYRKLVSKVVAQINQEGLHTIYGHDEIADYDQDGDGKIDFTQILVRNSVNKRKPYNYGSKDIGDGVTGMVMPEEIKFKDGSLGIGLFSYQGVGMKSISQTPSNIVIHELSHNLLGDNGFHTSGGNHFGTPNQYTSTSMGLQRGYGLMGGGSLVSCNGFERWRLGWTNHEYNPNKIPVSALNTAFELVSSDVKKNKQKQTIYLRDFVTYGDVVRIRLPYKDGVNASNQYLWLENHQVTKNEKLDWLVYSNRIPDCRPKGKSGVYAYIQVGKDVLIGDRNQVYSNNETDNLYIVSAEGNWDMEFLGKQWDCPVWGERSVFSYVRENPLSGANDQSPVFINRDTDVINSRKHGHVVSIKKKNGVVYDVGSDIGDEFDPFVDGSKLSLSTNPTPSNLRTYYVQQYQGKVRPVFPERNTNTIYLTGLSIDFETVESKEFGQLMKVEIDWDQYNVEEDVRWTGDIAVTEELVLTTNKTIDLDQNRNANIERRDPYTKEFAQHTTMTFKENSKILLEDNAQINIMNKSALVIEQGASLVINPGAKIVVEANAVLQLKAGAKVLIQNGGQLIVKEGGYFSGSPEAVVNCESCLTAMTITQDAVLGVPEGSSLENITGVQNIWEIF